MKTAGKSDTEGLSRDARCYFLTYLKRFVKTVDISIDKMPTSHKEEEVKPKLTIDDVENLLKADKTTKQKMENVFRALDVNREGEIDRTSLGVAFKDLGLGLNDDEVDAIMSDIDINSDGSIELEEFEDWFSQQDPVAIFLDAQYEVYAKKRLS